MAERHRIGELLLLKEKIDPWVLTNALKEQAASRQRLVSMLIGRALLDADEGAIVLSEQLGYPAAMQRHLERRDPAVIGLVPPELGARWVILPIGRARAGQLVVVARDPTPILAAALEHALKTRVQLAVTPGVQIERVIRTVYGVPAGADVEAPLPDTPPTLADIGDIQLDRDETPIPRRGRTVSDVFQRGGEVDLPAMRGEAPTTPIDATLAEIDRAITSSAVERIVMAYAAKRWRAALLARASNGRAYGVRGHGEFTADAVTLPLTRPSTLQIAHDTKRATTERPESEVQDQLADLLGLAIAPAAAPVIVASRVHSVLVVGDPVTGSPRTTLPELDRLVDALGAAYQRFSR